MVVDKVKYTTNLQQDKFTRTTSLQHLVHNKSR